MAGRVLGDDYLTADGEYCAAPLYSEGVEKWRRLENAEREKQALQSVPCPIAGIFAHAARAFAQRLATVRFPGSIQIPEGHSKLFQFPHVRRDDHADGKRMGVPSDGAVAQSLLGGNADAFAPDISDVPMRPVRPYPNRAGGDSHVCRGNDQI